MSHPHLVSRSVYPIASQFSLGYSHLLAIILTPMVSCITLRVFLCFSGFLLVTQIIIIHNKETFVKN